MRVMSGKVVGGKIEVDGSELREGEHVTVLASGGEEPFELSPEEARILLEKVREAERGEFVSEAELMGDLEGIEER